MNKQYGLIIPGQQKKPTVPVQREVARPSIFDESSPSDDDSDDGPPHMQMKKTPLGPSVMERRRARNLQAKALAEDPTIFQYDELYDDMESKREEEKQVKSQEPKKAKYITKLLETAEKRKLENELRVERQVQKEREAEGEQFKDKEAFVTSSYRKKLEEMRKLEEQNKRDDYLEAIGDVTKQKDLDGFYRHLYEQKMGSVKEVKKPELQPEIAASGEDEEHSISYKPIKSGKPSQQRAYRKRQSSEEEEDLTAKETPSLAESTDKKQHLTNNIDADSDFSIDESSSDTSSNDSDNEQDAKKNAPEAKKVKTSKKSVAKDLVLSTKSGNTTALNLDSLNKDKTAESTDLLKSVHSSKDEAKLPIPSVDVLEDLPPPPKPKRDKTEIWKKRTVGDVFDAAVQRYYERKATRSQA